VVADAIRAVPPDLDAELPARLSYCGRKLFFPNPHALDKLRYTTAVCGDYRHCDFCADTRARSIRARVAVAMAGGAVFVARLSAGLGRRLVRRVGKENTLRVPLDGDLAVIFTTGPAAEGTEITPGALPELAYFLDLVRAIPENKRITGKLGGEDTTLDMRDKRPAVIDDKPEPNTEPILVKMISHTADVATARRLYAEAFETVKGKLLSTGLDTARKVEDGIDILQTEFKRRLRAEKYTVDNQVTRTLECDLARIHEWFISVYVLNDKGATDDTARAGGRGPGG
jgi:hypothetical protein